MTFEKLREIQKVKIMLKYLCTERESPWTRLCYVEKKLLLDKTKSVTQTQGINSLSYSKFTHKIRFHNNYYKLTIVMVIL